MRIGKGLLAVHGVVVDTVDHSKPKPKPAPFRVTYTP